MGDGVQNIWGQLDSTPGAEEPRRRASITVTGGGLTGFIQSALNQVFASPWTSQQSGGASSSVSSPTTPTSTPATVTTSQAPSATSSSSTILLESESSEEDGTPASRRPRLDSEFVDLDFD